MADSLINPSVVGANGIDETSPDLLKNTPSNIARLEDLIENCKGRQMYLAQTRSPSDGGDVRWYFSEVPLAENELAPSSPQTEIVGKSDYFRFGMRDSLAIEASFLQREEELLSIWWKEYAECNKGPRGWSSAKKKLDKPLSVGSGSAVSSVTAASGCNTQGYKPPTLNELQNQNRLKARKFYGNKKKFNHNNNRFAPYAPRNTTSFIIRAKKSGGIASLVSPCPVTPAVLPTPIFSPSREVMGDMAKEEWGVDDYGSMKGLIRLRSPETGHDDEEDEDGGNGGDSSDSDVEEHVEVERRLDHDLSRFEMIYPSYGGGYNNVLENRVDDQDTHIAQLEEENLTLKERLFLMERELGDLRRRLQFLERQSQIVEDVNEEVVENGSENESEDCGSDLRVVTSAAAHDNVEILGSAAENARNVDVVMENTNGGMPRNEILMDVFMDEIAAARQHELNNEGKGDDVLKPKDSMEGIVRDKENDVRGSEFVEEKTVGEDKDEFVETDEEDNVESRCDKASNKAADNTETNKEEVHL